MIYQRKNSRKMTVHFIERFGVNLYAGCYGNDSGDLLLSIRCDHLFEKRAVDYLTKLDKAKSLAMVCER